MKRCYFVFLLLCVAFATAAQKPIAKPYFPEKVWLTKDPANWGFDTGRLAAAIRFAIEHESKAPRNLELAHAMTFGKEPFGDGVGPFSERGEPTGLIIHKGYIVASWGDPARVDMTFSVTKSFLST